MEPQVLEMPEIHVYEAVATLVKEGRRAGVGDVVHMTRMPAEDVRAALARLVELRMVTTTDNETYRLGAHDWNVFGENPAR